LQAGVGLVALWRPRVATVRHVGTLAHVQSSRATTFGASRGYRRASPRVAGRGEGTTYIESLTPAS
jgi:hypothetical protein